MIDELVLPDGLHNLTRDEYDRVDRVNFSTIKFMERSPAHYRYNLEHQATIRRLSKLGRLDDDDTDARQEGRIVSMAVFEPEIFRRRVAVWTGGKRIGKSWDRFVDNNPDCEHVTENTHRLALKLAGIVRSHPQAGPLLARGRGEVTVCWTFRREAIASLPGYEVQCKARIDWLGVGLIADLKRTRDASPAGFPREVANYLAHVQSAMYSDGVKAATGMDLPFKLIAIEPSPPNALQVWGVPQKVIEFGRGIYRGWLDRLNVCRIEKSWPEYGLGEIELELPRWVMPPDEEDF